MIALRIEVISSTKIEDSVSEALALAKKLDVNIKFEFNGVPVFVTPSSDADMLVDYYRADCKLFRTL